MPEIEYQPRTYVSHRIERELTIDGRMDESAWQEAAWTDAFVDIVGEAGRVPRFETRAKMLWDSTYFYVAAYLEEPHLWGTLTERDAVIYHDNDFEVFIDPNGDSHEYYELEINALGTEWDLLLIKPYRDGAPAVNAWDIQGLKTAVALDGTVNDPSDHDSGWSVEIAIPWKVLSECAHRPSPPHDGDVWWVNFSRVQWQLDTAPGSYAKRLDTTGSKPLPEDNWVWSPQGLIAMHYPEMWGLVQFSTAPPSTPDIEFVSPADLEVRHSLWQLYYSQKEFSAVNNRFCPRYDELDIPHGSLDGYSWPPLMYASGHSFTAVTTSTDGRQTLSINHEGRLTSSVTSNEGK